MKPITARKRRFILRYFESNEFGKQRLARMLKVSKSTVYRVFCTFKKSGKVTFEPGRCGRKPHPLTSTQVETIVTYRKKYKVCDTTLQALLKENGLTFSHNKIYRTLKANGLIHKQKNKRKRKDWVRFERKHSLSLWQADWKLLKNGQWIIAFKDDASRLVVAYGEFTNATSENSKKVLAEGIRQWGRPLAVLTGRDAQFYASDKKGKPSGNTVFQDFLEANHIKHIVGRVNHPQTCGKIERFFGEVERRLYTWHDFDTLAEVVHWHNELLPSRSLDFERLETPIQAFKRKMHHKRRIIKTVNEI
jgi:putative transposase